MKLYSYPVKYVDNDGETKDITTDIKQVKDGSFQTADSDIITTFSKRLSDGISMEHKNVDITMIPVMKNQRSTTELVSVLSEDSKTVTYPFGTETTLEYSLTYTGFKEDIVVNEYTGQTEYEFRLQTNGLFLIEDETGFYLADESGEIEANIGDVIIFTADERNNAFGSMTYQTVTAGEEYLLTIHVDADYLKDEKTVYPIRIDPTIEINYDNSGESGIRDVTINSLDSSSTANGSAGSLFVGKRDGYGISRVLMKFPGLNMSEILHAAQITGAEVELRDLMCETTEMSVRCHIFNGQVWWESTANWTNVNPNNYGTELSRNTISYSRGSQQETAHRYKFDVTEIVKSWKAGTHNKEKGIMFKGSETVETNTTYKHKTFASYNRSSYKPSLTVRYSEAANTHWDDVEAQGMQIIGTNRTFSFIPKVSGTYHIETNRPGPEAEQIAVQDTKIYLYNSSNELIAENDNKSSSDNYSKITRLLSGGSRYTVLIMQASENLAINCYFSVYKDGSLCVPIEEYTSLMRTFKKIGNYDREYNCLSYAVTQQAEGNTEKMWPNNSPTTTVDEVIDFLAEEKGKNYVEVNSYTANCVIAYGFSRSQITHFALSTLIATEVDKNEIVVTAKIGQRELMEHQAYNAYYSYSSYGSPQAYLKKVSD